MCPSDSKSRGPHEARTEPGETGREIARIRGRLAELEVEQASLTRRLTELLDAPPRAASEPPDANAITGSSSATAKIALFRRLFAGRQDVFPVRWENTKTGRSGYAPACANEWVKGVCGKPQVKCGECPNQAFIPVSDETIERHLRGDDRSRGQSGNFVAGVYPLLHDETCWFLAADFDGENWAADALAYTQTCRVKGVPAVLERSRSGEGGHVWIFFSEPVPARQARQLGSLLITETMERRPEIGFASYDRFFPSQDTMPIGGFGNLIALPLQPRAREQGNSMFVDDDLRPFDDQWAFLSSLPRLTPDAVAALVGEAEASGRVLGVRMPIEDDNADEPWRMPPSRRRESASITDPLPSRVTVVLADEVYVDRTGLPPAFVARLVRLAAFQNPEFYRAQAMRFPTYGKPRIISCAALHSRHVALPRGCLNEAMELLRSHGIEADVEDRRESGTLLSIRFLGALLQEQTAAFDTLACHDFGVLAATTAFGKTVVAAALIAHRGCNTLILVHRRELLSQWIERLKTFLSIEAGDIGVIGGGRRKPTGRIDVALIQSLVRKGEVSDLIGGYGQLIVDECHHLSAASFELVARRSKARYVLGLSATVARKDGHHPIIFMQCGPIRHHVNPKAQAAQRGFEHRVRLHQTNFRLPPGMEADRFSIAAIYAALAQDEKRNTLIFDDVLMALEAGRSPIVLTERRDHLEMLRERFKKFTRNLVVLRGGMGSVERRATETVMRSSANEERLILATGRYLGEGFDEPRLDTLFLTMPISWKGTLAQYVGRLHRQHQDKGEVIVYDYVDMAVPALARMAQKRQAGYRALGYTADESILGAR
jgi:superfamily II DNA or RNA helicase